jgi:predicted nucleic-acid-binding Zn-ribbon protein
MRNTYSCPKCRSPEILRIPEKPGHSGANNIYVGGNIFSAVLVTRYLCAHCGFTEEWVDDKADLEKLRAKYEG